jgi:hypothetical protein
MSEWFWSWFYWERHADTWGRGGVTMTMAVWLRAWQKEEREAFYATAAALTKTLQADGWHRYDLGRYL